MFLKINLVVENCILTKNNTFFEAQIFLGSKFLRFSLEKSGKFGKIIIMLHYIYFIEFHNIKTYHLLESDFFFLLLRILSFKN